MVVDGGDRGEKHPGVTVANVPSSVEGYYPDPELGRWTLEATQAIPAGTVRETDSQPGMPETGRQAGGADGLGGRMWWLLLQVLVSIPNVLTLSPVRRRFAMPPGAGGTVREGQASTRQAGRQGGC